MATKTKFPLHKWTIYNWKKYYKIYDPLLNNQKYYKLVKNKLHNFNKNINPKEKDKVKMLKLENKEKCIR